MSGTERLPFQQERMVWSSLFQENFRNPQSHMKKRKLVLAKSTNIIGLNPSLGSDIMDGMIAIDISYVPSASE